MKRKVLVNYLTAWPWVINNTLNRTRLAVIRDVPTRMRVHISDMIEPILDLITNPIVDSIEDQVCEEL